MIGIDTSVLTIFHGILSMARVVGEGGPSSIMRAAGDTAPPQTNGQVP